MEKNVATPSNQMLSQSLVVRDSELTKFEKFALQRSIIVVANIYIHGAVNALDPVGGLLHGPLAALLLFWIDDALPKVSVGHRIQSIAILVYSTMDKSHLQYQVL